MNWYEKYIEEGIRNAVKLLRDNGFNTFYSCHHAMVVECESYESGDIERLYNLLIENGYGNFKILLTYYTRENMSLQRTLTVWFYKSPEENLVKLEGEE